VETKVKPDLQFEFIVDRNASTITTVREFAAARPTVWDCYSKAELLDQWFSPKPLKTKTKSMDFREGGFWLYAMTDPGGGEYWGRLDYLKIRPIDAFSALDGFCDASGALNPDMPRSTWDVTFSDAGQRCVVRTVVTYKSADDIDKVVNMGLEAGLASTMEKLDELLETLAG
jgi:uncharacterized protein YndB with AHSA1/START domain